MSDGWHLGDDALAANTRKALESAGHTPDSVMALTAAEIRGLPQIGGARASRVLAHQEHVGRTRSVAAYLATIPADRRCPDCGAPRAATARSVVRDVWGNYRGTAAFTPRLPSCDSCHRVHGDLVRARAAELTGAAS